MSRDDGPPPTSRADFHSHLIPGVDDGAEREVNSRAALSAFRRHGIRRVITTPHFTASIALNERALHARLDEIDFGWTVLDGLARAEFPDVQVGRGVEVLLDHPEPQLGDRRLRLGGGRFVLVEYSFGGIPPNSALPLRAIRAQGFVPVIAHPERYVDVAARLSVVRQWLDAGAFLQVNLGSIVGEYGSGPKRVALKLLQDGVVSYLSSDYHARGDFRFEPTATSFARLRAGRQFEMLTITNPCRLMDGMDPLPVPPIPSEGFLDRVKRTLRV